MQCISDMAKRALDGDFKKIYKCWNTVVGYIKSDKPHWIIDVDIPSIKNNNKNICYGNGIVSQIENISISEFIEYECEPLHYTKYYLYFIDSRYEDLKEDITDYKSLEIDEL